MNKQGHVEVRTRKPAAAAAALVMGLSVFSEAGARTLMVDQRGGADFRSLVEAVATIQPGDQIKIVPGSGPYREILLIPVSGTAQLPIVVDGSGETITGFEMLEGFTFIDGKWSIDLSRFWNAVGPVQGFQKKNGRWSSSIRSHPLPFVLCYQGKRVRQDSTTGQLIDHGSLSSDGGRLTLDSATTSEGWEISVRPQVVKILHVSHHHYKNLGASGSLNDGFNLHGKGSNIFFENIESHDNLDDGFSAHDDISCVVSGGRFYRNDNGITNVKNSVMVADSVRAFDNLGWGVAFLGASATIENLQAEANGVAELVMLQGAIVTANRVRIRSSPWHLKPWVTSQESAAVECYNPIERDEASSLLGEPLRVEAP